MSRKKKRSKADEFEKDGVGLDGEYNDALPAEDVYDDAHSYEPERRAPKAKKK